MTKLSPRTKQRRAKDLQSRAIVRQLIDLCADEMRTVPGVLKRKPPSGKGRPNPLRTATISAISWLMCKRYDWEYSTIARALDVHHSSVMGAVNAAVENEDTRGLACVVDGFMTIANGNDWHKEGAQ